MLGLDGTGATGAIRLITQRSAVRILAALPEKQFAVDRSVECFAFFLLFVISGLVARVKRVAHVEAVVPAVIRGLGWQFLLSSSGRGMRCG